MPKLKQLLKESAANMISVSSICCVCKKPVEESFCLVLPVYDDGYYVAVKGERLHADVHELKDRLCACHNECLKGFKDFRPSKKERE